MAASAPAPLSSLSSSSLAKIFDDTTLSSLHFLESHPGITKLEFFERSGIARRDLSAWEAQNAPYLLPEDLSSFLLISDGLLLRWNIQRKAGEEISLGKLSINSLSKITRLSIPTSSSSSSSSRSSSGSAAENPPSDMSSDDDDLPLVFSESDEDPSDSSQRPSQPFSARSAAAPPKTPKTRQYSACFDLDSSCTDGRVVLMYRHKTRDPQIFFQDFSNRWFFIASSFTDYFRLMVLHLGLPSWQYAFTDAGLPPISRSWFSYLSPDRLMIDNENRRRLEAMLVAEADNEKKEKTPASASAKKSANSNIPKSNSSQSSSSKKHTNSSGTVGSNSSFAKISSQISRNLKSKGPKIGHLASSASSMAPSPEPPLPSAPSASSSANPSPSFSSSSSARPSSASLRR